MDTENPHSKMTIITPVFDTPAAYLDALCATLSPIVDGDTTQWLLVDDGSTRTGTCAALATLEGRPGVSVIRNAGRKGAAGARNFGARTSESDWLYFIDADDLPVVSNLQLLRTVVESRPDIGWLSGDFEQFEEAAPAPPDPAIEQTGPIVTHWADAAARLVFETWVNQGSYIIRRELFFAAGGFDERFEIGEDWLLWMRLAADGKLFYLPRVVYWQRRGHASTMSGPLSLSDAIVRPYLAARREARFAGYRKPLRWRIIKLYRLLAERNQQVGRRGPSVRFALQAALWSVNDLQQWTAVLRAALGQPIRRDD